MDGKNHKDLLDKTLNPENIDKIKKLIEKVNTRIDSTSQSKGSGPQWHRSDFTHDPRVQGVKVAADNPETWWKNFSKIKNAKIITSYHQIQDVAVSQPGQIVNGHEVTPEMIEKCKTAVEEMQKGIKPDLRKFPWTSKNGPTMAPGSQANNVAQNIKSALTLDKLGKAGKSGGLIGAGISGVISVVKNGRAVYKNEKTLKEAGISTVKDVGAGGVSGYVGSVAGYTTQVVVAGLMISNPVGWVVGTVTIGSSLIVGFAAGAVANKAYNKVWNGTPKLFKKMKKWFS